MAEVPRAPTPPPPPLLLNETGLNLQQRPTIRVPSEGKTYDYELTPSNYDRYS
jgi:hypothetical protein